MTEPAWCEPARDRISEGNDRVIEERKRILFAAEAVTDGPFVRFADLIRIVLHPEALRDGT